MTKVVTLPEAIATVEDGAHVGLTGFAITRNAVAAAGELVRAGRRHLTISQVIGGIETDLLAAGGCIRYLNYSGGSLDRFGPLHSVNRSIASGDIQVREHSALALSLRLHAGSLGLPFVPVRSMLGSELLGGLLAPADARVGEDPFTGAPVVYMAPLRPDVAIVHADAADEDGNSVISGPTWAIKETALAADSVIVTAERVVRAGELDPDTVTIPSTVVAAVAEVEGGGRPTAVFGQYDYDGDRLRAHAAAAEAGDEVLARYLDEQALVPGSRA